MRGASASGLLVGPPQRGMRATPRAFADPLELAAEEARRGGKALIRSHARGRGGASSEPALVRSPSATSALAASNPNVPVLTTRS